MSISTASQSASALTSWKEIANYLGKGVRTAQRWERDLGLPVLRPIGKPSGFVSSSPSELDRWRARHWSQGKNQSHGKKGNGGLKQELAATKEYLQSFTEALESTNEELQSANEEIQSGNEELQSTNEELQTSKEELESANEELQTVNDEMQRRNDLLSQLNNDLSNLLNSVSLPLLMVGRDLSVRRFTPQATKALGLTESDIGRPLSRLRLKVNVTDLEQMMLDVMADVRPKQSRVRVSAGQWYDLRLTPYRTADNRIDGVVLSIPSLDYLQSIDIDKGSVVSKPRAARAKQDQAKKKASKRR
jgi:two-component system, chemotaxis family, CheB/CheR fusion protein